MFWADDDDVSYNAATKASAKGKIVGLDELTNTLWSTEKVATDATSETDGAGNTVKVLALATYTAEKYPAFVWCKTKNTPAVAGISWYIPAMEELRYGLGDNQTVLNAALSNIPGAALLSPSDYSGYYWSSTEYSDMDAYKVAIVTDFASNSNKATYSERFRVVSAF